MGRLICRGSYYAGVAKWKYKRTKQAYQCLASQKFVYIHFFHPKAPNFTTGWRSSYTTKYRINLREVYHQYPTGFSHNSFYYKRSACKTTSFAITLRGPTIWNSFLSLHEKSIPHLLSFLKQIKFKLLKDTHREKEP